MLGTNEKIFIRLLTGLVNVFYHSKCILLSNQKCQFQLTLINLHSNEYMNTVKNFTTIYFQLIQIDVGSSNTLNDLGNISKDYTTNNMKITRLNGYVYEFSVE